MFYLNSGRSTGGVDADDSQAPGDVHHAEPEHDVGAGTLAHSDNALDAENVEDVDQVLADLLQTRELDVVGEVFGVILLPHEVDVDEDGSHLDAEHRRVVDERLEAVVVHSDVVDSLEKINFKSDICIS